jgi:hypothetical protein
LKDNPFKLTSILKHNFIDAKIVHVIGTIDETNKKGTIATMKYLEM